MPREFRAGRLSFLYPDNWREEREDTGHGWTVSVYSSATAFLTLSLDTDAPDADEVAAAVLEALREDYPELEADEAFEVIAGRAAVGHDINFFSLDLTNTCWTRSFSSLEGTVLLLCQAADIDLPRQGPVLRAICASLKLDED